MGDNSAEASGNHLPEAPPQLTKRALWTGLAQGALLAPCNIYSGLKIGWAFNMSIAAALLSYGGWHAMNRRFGTRPWGLLENNLNQTAASSAASVASAGLVAPIPALALLTGHELGLGHLILWVACVSGVGIVVALGLRRQMLEVDRLPFPSGIATARTLQEIYAQGPEARHRIRMLMASGGAAGALKIVRGSLWAVPKVSLWPSTWLAPAHPFTLRQLGFVLDPSLLMVAFGAIVGLRVGASLLLGAACAWGGLAPWIAAQGWVEASRAAQGEFAYSTLVAWLLWPGVSLMVSASLTSFVLSSRTAVAGLLRLITSNPDRAKPTDHVPPSAGLPKRAYALALAAAAAAAIAGQMLLFDIELLTASVAVLLTFALAVVAGRVSGETGITPIGAMGKVTQLTFGVAFPADATSNLMAANVTGGAAGQCADLLHDLKTGHLVGAVPSHQAVAQVVGVAAGAVTGSAAYLLLIPVPSEMLLTPEWPAPAVATWKAVAEVFMEGAGVLPEGALQASVLAAATGVALAVGEKLASPRLRHWIPSPASMGLAFVIPAWNSVSMCLGAAAAWLLYRTVPRWANKYVMVAAAGLVAGESLAGVGQAIYSALFT